MLTAKQHELLLYIQRKLEESGISPSFEEMKDALDLKSKSGVHRLISALEERGFLRRLPNRARALEVLRQPENVTASPRAASANDTVVTLTASQTLTNKTLTSPTLTTPALGVATATSINKVAPMTSMYTPKSKRSTVERWISPNSGRCRSRVRAV